jgi:hypothetical protein
MSQARKTNIHIFKIYTFSVESTENLNTDFWKVQILDYTALLSRDRSGLICWRGWRFSRGGALLQGSGADLPRENLKFEALKCNFLYSEHYTFIR